MINFVAVEGPRREEQHEILKQLLDSVSKVARVSNIKHPVEKNSDQSVIVLYLNQAGTFQVLTSSQDYSIDLELLCNGQPLTQWKKTMTHCKPSRKKVASNHHFTVIFIIHFVFS